MSNELGKIPYEKSNNIENSLLLIKGRIIRRTFWWRFFLCTLVWIGFYCIFEFWAEAEYYKYLTIGGGKIQAGAAAVETRYKIFGTLTFIVVPLVLLLFSLIQAIKRVHDANVSGWNLLLPIYNLFLLFAEGTDADNNFGVNPRKSKLKYCIFYKCTCGYEKLEDTMQTCPRCKKLLV